MGIYRTVQICLNGHIITGNADTELAADFCAECGKMTILQCPSCEAKIRGYYHVDGVVSTRGMDGPPAFCHGCGEPYPWTQAKLEAARELADELDGLDEEEREKLKGTLDDLIRDTPRTDLAATRFKKLVSKAHGVAVSALRDITVNLATESAKKMLSG